MNKTNRNRNWKHRNNYGYKKPFTNLAAAVLEFAKRDNDVRFIKSDWCECLRTMCRLDDVMFGQTNIDYLNIY